MPKIALVSTLHAETALIIRAWLLSVRFSLDWMAKHACVLLVALTELDEKGADRHLLGIESVQVATLVAFLAGASEPVNAHLCLLLALVLSLH